MSRSHFLEHKDYRYLKLVSLLAAVAIMLFWMTHPADGTTYGGTWFGYMLGIASALLVILLAWYGMRKRVTPRDPERRKGQRRQAVIAADAERPERDSTDRRQTPAEDSWRFGGTLQGWLSAHIYLGMLLLILVSLHSGLRFGWNIHTLTYLLVLLILASGLYGTYAYLRYPSLISENIGEDTLSDLLLKIAELDELARLRALCLPDEVNELVTRARLQTCIGGGFLRQLGCRRRSCPTDDAVIKMQELGRKLIDGEQPRMVRDLYAVLLQKQGLVARARKDISLNARMQFWLYFHVPLTLALLGALFAHVAAILIYW